MANYKEIMQRIAEENPLPKVEYNSTGEGEGPWTRELLAERLDAWGVEYDETNRKDGAYQILCPGNEGWPDGEIHDDIRETLGDDTIVYVENGWPRFSCRHAHCTEGSEHGKKTWMDLQNFYDPNRELHVLEQDENIHVGDPNVEEDSLDATPTEDGESSRSVEDSLSELTPKQERKRVKDNIMEIRHTPGKDKPAWQKAHEISELVYISLKKTGKLYNVGNVCVYLDNQTRRAIEVVHKGNGFHALLMEYGLHPGASDKAYVDAIGLYLNAKVVNKPKTKIYAGSYYDTHNHVLYVNEWYGSILKITGDGLIQRIQNGDDGVLMLDGEAVNADQLHADIDTINANAQAADQMAEVLGADPDSGYMDVLRMDDESLIKRHIFDVILYDEVHGVSKQHSQEILMTALVGLFFIERIPSYPYIYFFGPGGSMKTSLAVKVGRLIIGPKFKATPSTSEEDELKIMAINNPFLILDEANNLKKLNNIMKAIATGAQDARRELYTTTQQRISDYQARIWLTANTMDSNTETVSSRMMMIDVAARTEAEPYRSEYYLDKEWTKGGLRDKIWTELIRRLSGAMQALAHVDHDGHGDVGVTHRMSSFFVFGLTLAKREGREKQFREAMEMMALRQTSATAEALDIITLIRKLPPSYNGRWMTAEELAGLLPTMCGAENIEQKRMVSRPGWVRHHLTNSSHTLKATLGMKIDVITTKTKNKKNVYSFTGCEGDGNLIDPNIVDDAMMTPPAPATAPAVEQPAVEQPAVVVVPAHRCECTGCRGCDPKDQDKLPCWRKTKDKKCSQCRQRFTTFDREDEPVPDSGEGTNSTEIGSNSRPAEIEKVVQGSGQKKQKMTFFDLDELD